MSQVVEVIERYEVPELPPTELPEEDGIPLESNWHRLQINLLVDLVTYRWRERRDFFAGGNMFIYYSLEQVRKRDYKGPDFFLVKDVDDSYSRGKWVVWEEGGRYPDVIIELLSPTTAHDDLGRKKELYERTFHTPEYYCYDPDSEELWGWRLTDQGYEPLTPNDQGRLWSAQLEAWVGRWEGAYLQVPAVWLRLFDREGQLIPTEAEAERQRAEAAEAELVRVREELEHLKQQRGSR